MLSSTFVDTNVFAYAMDSDEPQKRAIALDLLANPSETFVISAQVLSELYVVLTRKLRRPLSGADAAQRIDELATLPVVAIDAPLIRAAIALSIAAGVSYWDAAIVMAAASTGCRRIVTEDLQDGIELAGVTIENPFRS